MALKTSDAPNFSGMSQRQIDAWWEKRPKKRVRVLRAFQMISKAYDDSGNCIGFKERYNTVPGVVLELTPLMASEMIDCQKVELVPDTTPLTRREDGPDPYGWLAHCKAVTDERARVPASHQQILAALTSAVQGTLKAS